MKIETLKLGENAGNCYILTDEVSGDIAVIDPAYYVDELKAAIEPIKDRVKYILLTHRHFDHILGAWGVKKQTGAKIAICEEDADGLRSTKASLYDEFAYMLPHEQTPVEPDILLHEGDTITLGSLTITVMQTPGHTAGSVCYIVGDVMFSGDTLFDGAIGRTDLESGSPRDMRASLRRLRGIERDYLLYPGHGGTTTLNNERHFNSHMEH